MLPEKNIFWKNLPSGTIVEETKTAFIAHLPDNQKATIYWNGNDAKQAQQFLKYAASEFIFWGNVYSDSKIHKLIEKLLNTNDIRGRFEYGSNLHDFYVFKKHQNKLNALVKLLKE